MGASVRARLLDMAKKTGRDFDAVLVRYFQERFLYRLSRSPYERHFILKGALLFLVYEMPFFRPTKDIDFLGSATSNDMGNIKSMIREIAGLHLPDGVIFYPDSVKAERIKEDADYEGVRVKLEATLSGARKTLQLDIGFGDIVVPGPVEMEFPVLLEGLPVPSLMVYSKESAIAEKFEALVKLNFLTSRMKDVYDILFLASQESFRLATMREAIGKLGAVLSAWSRKSWTRFSSFAIRILLQESDIWRRVQKPERKRGPVGRLPEKEQAGIR